MATTLEVVQGKIRKLEQQAEALIAKQTSGVIEKIRDLMEKHNLTAADIDAHAPGKQRSQKTAQRPTGKSTPSAARYRDPKTGATWSGHGRAPAWIATAKNRDRFLIDAPPAIAKQAPASKTKSAGAYVRGPQRALYRDPKSGATWSGRGRAPAWLASAKDRSKFLIDGATAAPATASKTDGPNVATTKIVARNATTKKVVVKKAPVEKSPVVSKKTASKKASASSAKKAAANRGADVVVKRSTLKKVAAEKTPSTRKSGGPADIVPETAEAVKAADAPVDVNV
ncbi:H-NS family nucleoid-associated regulatory protein [Paraburkholderia fungorum]|uniref:H-NS family nucleoid-associated regulatory protein n=1 Tax=Paraburkholderia fungorum TaxID=134537 RepID=UPI0038B76058